VPLKARRAPPHHVSHEAIATSISDCLEDRDAARISGSKTLGINGGILQRTMCVSVYIRRLYLDFAPVS